MPSRGLRVSCQRATRWHCVARFRVGSPSAGRTATARRLQRPPGRRARRGTKGALVTHDRLRDCIDACEECADECEHCAAACLHEHDVKALANCIRLNRDCADVCRLAAALMARNSPFAEELCDFCADVCDACGAECERHEMEHCRLCAAACRACAEECRRMASGIAGDRASGTQHAM
jgi:hypothetical protein